MGIFKFLDLDLDSAFWIFKNLGFGLDSLNLSKKYYDVLLLRMASESTPPKDFLARANNELWSKLAEKFYISMLQLSLRPRSFELTIAAFAHAFHICIDYTVRKFINNFINLK